MINCKFFLHSFLGPCSNCVTLHNLTRFTPSLQLHPSGLIGTPKEKTTLLKTTLQILAGYFKGYLGKLSYLIAHHIPSIKKQSLSCSLVPNYGPPTH